MEIVKALIPLATFLLGVLATLAFKHYDRRREVIRENVQALCGLAEDWYNRVQTLGRTVAVSPDRKTVEEALVSYLHGSLYLPRFRRSMALLDKHKKCEPFLEEARAFLSELTQMEQIQLTAYTLPWRENNFAMMRCRTTRVFESGRSEEPVRRLLLLPSKVIHWYPRPTWGVGGQGDLADDEAESGFDATDPEALMNLYARVQKLHLEAANLIA